MRPVTRTYGQLHFEDLDPHRFEDLVRQIAFNFRNWSALEAIGRSGADGGADTRAVERIAVEAPPLDDEDSDEPPASGSVQDERIWLIQCKREKTIAAAKARRIVQEAVPTPPAPYGLIVAAACDFSAKTRAAFREEAARVGLTEILLWGKAELEDLLFQPANDNLLFAYFGISLSVRRRSQRSLASARLTTKRRLIKVLGDLRSPNYDPVLLRDANSTEYPRPDDEAAFKRQPLWRYFRCAGHLRPGHIAFVVRESFATLLADGTWDFIKTEDTGYPRHPELVFGPERDDAADEAIEFARRYWLKRVPEIDRATLRQLGFVHYDRIVAVDEIGDAYHPGPHLLIDCVQPNVLFDDFRFVVETRGYAPRFVFAEEETRRNHFPAPLPAVPDEEYFGKTPS